MDNDGEAMASGRLKEKKAYCWRPLRNRYGELVQWDTSNHDWLEERGEKLYLIAMVDDATSPGDWWVSLARRRCHFVCLDGERLAFVQAATGSIGSYGCSYSAQHIFHTLSIGGVKRRYTPHFFPRIEVVVLESDENDFPAGAGHKFSLAYFSG